ncbi:aldehyde dehydrogenase family protein [[Mycoplasma] anseris]|uniref:Aldehyde dehydrogenase n=1 Tax=[Mycoplasma] anseris TaxID=92400 RepID=A0A2Z4NCB0_9BACT|nr:aldehyde dehydrogenase family protein [[Mycoplasma] anseris]AWX69182.1 aldehyde dehydrogenase [[Mycoplasma] anseris]
METIDIKTRIFFLKKLRDTIIKYEGQIINALFLDLNKNETESQITELRLVIKEINLYLKKIKSWSKIKKTKNPLFLYNLKSFLKPTAFGKVLIISPWNYPINLSLIPLIDAFGAGNQVLLKPSEFSINSSLILKQIIEEVFPKELVSIHLGDKEIVSQLLNQDLDFIFFTGNSFVGQIIYEQAAKKLIPCVLELGGKSPVIIDKDKKNLKKTCQEIIWAKLVNLGQTCVAPDYVFVHQDQLNEVIKTLKDVANSMYKDNKNNIAKIIDQPHLLNIAKLDNEIQYNLAKNKIELLIKPVLLNDNLMSKELFGPILPIVSYTNLQEVFNYIQTNKWPLSIYVFSDDKTFVNEIIKNTNSGTLSVNEILSQVSNPYLGFGGIGKSGFGKYHGKTGFDTFSHYRPIVYKKSLFSNSLKYKSLKNDQTFLKFVKKIIK